jgi:sulfur-oxidizing protein SoxY
MDAKIESIDTCLTRRHGMQTRRESMKHSLAVASLLAGVGLAPKAWAQTTAKAAFEAKSLADVVKALGGSAPVESKEVAVQGPDIAENGAVVPVGCSTTMAGVKRMLILVEKNPSALAAVFHVSDAVEASFNARVKMGQSSNVYAVALMADGKAYFAQKDIKVTLGGCGG